MILFPFATQATEPAPGASIEEPRLLIDGMYDGMYVIEEPRLLLDGFFTDRKHKQTQANTGSTQTEHTHRHPRDHQRAREPRQARSQRPQEKGTRADRAPRTERHKDSQDSRPQPVTESTGQGTGDRPLPQHLSDKSVGPPPY